MDVWAGSFEYHDSGIAKAGVDPLPVATEMKVTSVVRAEDTAMGPTPQRIIAGT